MTNEKNKIGKRAENIFAVLIGKFIESKNCHLLIPEFLGDKYPVIDFIVDLNNYDKSKAFFFVSVRATRMGYTKNEKNLKVSFNKKDMDRLKKIPVPTYIAGIEEKEVKGYIMSLQNINSDNISSFSTKYPINDENIEILWNEITEYWNKSNELTQFKSHFKL